MLDFNAPEFLVVGIVALLVIGPKDLPKAMRFVGQWVGKARRVAGQFRAGLDTMVREAELAEMEKKWAEENARIMREHPPEALPAPETAPVAAPISGPVYDPNPDGATPAQIVAETGEGDAVTTPAPVIRDDPAPDAKPAR